MAELGNVRRILVLDDDELMRDLLETLLSMQGYQVSLADSGPAAFDLLSASGSSSPFDLVLTDLQMPQLEGEALAQGLRAAMPTPGLLIGMSARPALDGERRVLDAFLPKPFDMPQFEAVVRAAQAKAADRDAEQVTPAPSPGDSAPPTDTADAPTLNEVIFSSLAKMLPVPQLLELYDLTLADVAKRHTHMMKAAEGGDLSAVQREAHAVKGACGMVGAAELQSLAATIEGETSLNTAVLSQIPAACQRLRRMLDTKLQAA